MTNRSISLTDELYDYILAHSLREPPLLQQLRAETAQMPMARMQIAPEQGQFMALLVKLIGARRALEIGVFTGYSALWIALALPETGQLIACDKSAEWTTIAQRYWQQAGITSKIDLRLAPAIATLESLIAEGQQAQFDFAFIDADKQAYDAYYELCLILVRPGGLIVLDNMLQNGRVLGDRTEHPNAQAIHALNQKIHQDDRVEMSLTPFGDGLTLARRL